MANPRRHHQKYTPRSLGMRQWVPSQQLLCKGASQGANLECDFCRANIYQQPKTLGGSGGGGRSLNAAGSVDG